MSFASDHASAQQSQPPLTGNATPDSATVSHCNTTGTEKLHEPLSQTNIGEIAVMILIGILFAFLIVIL